MVLDNFRTIELIWDRANKSIIKTVKTASSDTTGRYLSVKILDGGQEVTLNGASLQLYWEHPNFNTRGTDNFNTVNNGGLFQMTFSGEMLTNVGELDAYLVLTLPDGKITSDVFKIKVIKGSSTGVVIPSNGESAAIQAIYDAMEKLNNFDGGPSIFMNSLNELQTAYPNGAPGVALVNETNPAKIYVWNGTAWEDFGDYQGIEIKDGTITNSKYADSSITANKLVDSNRNSEWLNIYRPSTNKFGGYYDATTGLWVDDDRYSSSDYIPVKVGSTYKRRNHQNTLFWDANKKLIRAQNYGSSSFDITDPNVYYITLNNFNSAVTDALYELTHAYTLGSSWKIGNDNIKDATKNSEWLNIYNPATNKIGGYYDTATGLWVNDTTYISSDYIPVKVGSTYKRRNHQNTLFWDANKKLIRGQNYGSSSFEITDPNVAYLTLTNYNSAATDALYELTHTYTFDEIEIVPNQIKGVQTTKRMSDNLYSKSETVVGEYISSTGQVVVDERYAQTDFKSIKFGEKLFRNSSGNCIFFDTNKEFVSYTYFDKNTEDHIEITSKQIAYVKMTMLATEVQSFIYRKEYDVYDFSPEIWNIGGATNNTDNEFLLHKIEQLITYVTTNTSNLFDTNKKRETMVSIIVDDANVMELDTVVPLMVDKGISMGFGVITDFVGKTIDDWTYMTWEQIRKVEMLGGEIMAHTHQHRHSTRLTPQELYEDISKNKQILAQKGFIADGFIYPYNDYNDQTIEVVKKKFKYSFARYDSNTPVLNKNKITRYSLGSYFDHQSLSPNGFKTYSLDYYKERVDIAKAQNDWLVFVVHVNPDTYQPNQLQRLSDTIDYIKSLNIPIVSPREGFERFGNIVEIGDLTIDASGTKTGELS